MSLRTDLSVVQYPSPLPSVGGFLGSNTIFTDPNFGTRIVRVTDGATSKGKTLQTADASQAGIWNQNDTLLLVTNTGGVRSLYQFTPATMKCQLLPFTTGDSVCFSKVHPGVLYTLDGSKVYQNTFTLVNGEWTGPTAPTVVCDFSKILPAGSVVKWTSSFLVSEDDSTITVGLSSGVQNSAFYACSWQKGHKSGGYRMLNTETGAVTGDWGPTGTATFASPTYKFPVFLHEVYQTPNSSYAALTPVGTTDTNFIWSTATLSIIDCQAGGHKAYGEAGWFGGGPGGGQIAHALYTTPALHTMVVLPANLPAAAKEAYKEDLHFSFGKYVAGDASVMYAGSGANGPMPFTAAWENEIIGYDVVAGTVARVCHTFDSNKSKRFTVLNAIPVPSQSGKFIAFTSDFMGALGSEAGASTVSTLGDDARGDVFIVATVKS